MTVLHGIRHEDSTLSIIAGHRNVLSIIFKHVARAYLPDYVDRETGGLLLMGNVMKGNRYFYSWSDRGRPLVFPAPQGININMMPIRYFDTKTIPQNCRGYIPFIQECPLLPTRATRSLDKVVYLTIHESWVEVGSSHRRAGLHVERPGCLQRGRIVKPPDQFSHESEHHQICWGLGRLGRHLEGDIPVDGIFMASNVDDSSRVYDVLIKSPHDVSDSHGGIEHLRDFVGEGVNIPANSLCWITDSTPHESLPIRASLEEPGVKRVYRQFFRLVVGEISLWYSKHNTPNPFGIMPDATISYINKFESYEPPMMLKFLNDFS